MRLLWLLLLASVTTLAPQEALGAAARDPDDDNGLDVLNTADDTESGNDVPAYYVLQPEFNPRPPDPQTDPDANGPGVVRVVRQDNEEVSPQPAATAKPSQETKPKVNLDDDDDGFDARIRSVQDFGEIEYEQDVHYIASDIFHKDYWPPKKPDGGGAEYDQTPQGLKEWKADRKKAFATWNAYIKLIQAGQQDMDGYLDSVTRPYPYCVTGIIPNFCPPATIKPGIKDNDEPTDKECAKFDATKNPSSSVGPEKDETQLPVHNNWYPMAIYNVSTRRFTPMTEFGKPGAQRPPLDKQVVDLHLERYIPLFHSQPPSGEIEQLLDNGKAPDVTETRKTSYLDKVEFRYITAGPNNRDGLLWPEAETNSPGAGRQMLGWTHIIVTAKEPLQGVFIQAISYPNGLPFGEFRDDFECAAGGYIPGVSSPDSVRMLRDGFKKRTILPCRYSHGVNNGDVHPTVYAFGGSRMTSTNEKPPEEASRFEEWNYGWYRRSVFRTHFRWSNVHCNFKMRVQFIIMAVKNFEDLKFEVFRTTTYVLQMTHASGSPPPYVKSWSYDCSVSNVFIAKPKDLINNRLKSTEQLGNKKSAIHTALYVVPSSRINIAYDSSYDRCILHYHGYGHFGNTPQCKPTNVGNPDCPPGSDTCSKDRWICNTNDLYHFDVDDPQFPTGTSLKKFEPPPKSLPGGVKPYQVFPPKLTAPVGYPPVGVCPPAEICINSLHREEGLDTGPGFRAVRNFFDYYRDWDGIEDCDFPSCTRPKEPRPFNWGNTGNSQAGEGVDFGLEFHKNFDSRNAALFRRLRGEHVWTLTLSWFVLMFVGNFVGRYYKETAGVHIDGSNSILGLGWWIWVHMFLLLLSATFMWIGILVVMKIRRLEPGCNQLEKFEEFTLKNYCRQRHRIVRFHRNAGYVALCLYLIAFFMAWRRPNKSYTIKKPFRFRFNERKFYFWMHIVFAYASKFAAVVCVAILLWVETEGICKDVPILVLVLEFFSIGFFITGHIIQRKEDKTSGMSRSKVIPEAIDANVTKKWYKIKFILVMVTCAVHYLMFLIIMIIGFFIYNRNGEGYDSKEPRFEVIKGFLHWGCNVTNKQAEVDIYIDRFPFLAALSKTD